MASRLREQRDVVTPALIAVGPAQVYDSRRMIIRARGARQILAGRNHARALDLERPIARVIDDNEYRHGRNSRLRGYTTSRLASCVTMPSRIAASTRSTLIQYSCGDPYGLGWYGSTTSTRRRASSHPAITTKWPAGWPRRSSGAPSSSSSRADRYRYVDDSPVR